MLAVGRGSLSSMAAIAGIVLRPTQAWRETKAFHEVYEPAAVLSVGQHPMTRGLIDVSSSGVVVDAG